MSGSGSTEPRPEPRTIPAGSVRLAGDVLLPPAGGRHPAVVLVHGSGGQTRDAHRDVAVHFARHGIAALIYDKRGSGASTGDWRDSDFHDLGSDAAAAVRVLAAHPGVDATRIGLWGFSEGGWITPLAAGICPEVAFLIVVSACGVNPVRQDVFRRANVMRPRGRPVVALDALGWKLSRGAARLLPDSWLPLHAGVRHFRKVFDFEPAPIWAQVTQPTLAIWGAGDRLVPVAMSAACIAAALRRGGNRHHALTVFPGADHGMRVSGAAGGACRHPASFAPGYLDLMVSWIQRVARHP